MKVDIPSASFSFQLSFVDNEEDSKIGFQEVTGIKIEMEVAEVGSGGENRFKYSRLQAVNTSNLVLKRGLATSGSTFLTWVLQTLEGSLSTPIVTKHISLTLLDFEGKAVKRWDFANAFPVKWEISEFKALESAVAIESIEFAYTFFITKWFLDCDESGFNDLIEVMIWIL